MRKELQIIKAAFSVFSEKGIFNSSVDDVAKLAGVSKKTIYLHFKSKDELVEKTFAWQMENISISMDKVIKLDIHTIEKMNLYLVRICELMENISVKAFQDLAKLKMLSVKTSNEFLKKAVFIRFNHLVEQAKAEGLLKPDIQIGDCLMSYWNLLSPFLLMDLSEDSPMEVKKASSLSKMMRKQLLQLYKSILNDEGNNQLDGMIHP